MQDDNKTLVNGLETGIDGIKFIPKSPKIESEEFVQVFKSDSVDDMAKKIIYKFKIGQSCTITGMVIASGKGYREATQSDILADEDMMGGISDSLSQLLLQKNGRLLRQSTGGKKHSDTQ